MKHHGKGLNTRKAGVIRTRAWLMELGAKRENIYRNSNGILLVFPLPVPIK